MPKQSRFIRVDSFLHHHLEDLQVQPICRFAIVWHHTKLLRPSPTNRVRMINVVAGGFTFGMYFQQLLSFPLVVKGTFLARLRYQHTLL